MKKFVKAFLTMAMCFSMLSSNALAAESEMNISRYEGHRYTFEIHQYT